MTTTDNGVATTDLAFSTEDDGSEAFLARFMPSGDPDASKKKELSEEGDTTEKTPTTPEETEETSDPESPEETEETEEEAKPKERKFTSDDDDTYVKIKEGEAEHEVSVKELKRLWGQEASLTRKSQEVADQRKHYEAETTKVVASYTSLLERAKAAAEPYTKINFLVAAQKLQPDELQGLMTEAQARFDDVKFLEEGLNQHLTELQTKQKATIAEQAQACVKTLSDPESPHHIPEWGDKVYGELRTFAVDSGLSKDIFNQLVDPAAMKLLHMAQQYKKGLSKVLTTKVNKTPKKIIKSTKVLPTPAQGDKAKADKAMARLKRDGDTDAAAEAFLTRWNSNAEE